MKIKGMDDFPFPYNTLVVYLKYYLLVILVA